MSLAPKVYQQQVLDSASAYFMACRAAGLPRRHAVFLPACAHRRWQDLAGGQEHPTCQHTSAALRAQRDYVAGAQQGRILFWVRNLVRREGSSFFLQKAEGGSYPDFLCQLPGTANKPGPALAVEYKGADRWTAAEDDRLIGDRRANLSEGCCRFVMVKEKRWEGIEENF
jgi:hypothetical protein